MTPRTRRDRRRALRTLAGGLAAALSGCEGMVSPGTPTSRSPQATIAARRDALRDEPLAVRITGIEPGAAVTLTATATDDRGREWTSSATFRADDEGRVALAEQSPVAGDYEGVRPMGFVWSMRLPDRPGPFFRRSDRFAVDLSATVDGQAAATATLTRRHVAPAVSRTEVSDDVVGVLFEPPGDGPHPGVLALHGSGGRPLVDRARLLASRGYATLAVQYFGDPDPLPGRLSRVPLSYFDDARRWLSDRPAVAAGDVGLVGASRGGELALVLGARYDWTAAVVAYVPSGLVLRYPGNGDGPWAADGNVLPAVEVSQESVRAAVEAADETTVEAATIPVEGVDAPLLLVSAGDDALWPSTYLSQVAERRLATAAVDFPHAHLRYEDAGHLVGAPYLPTTHRDALRGRAFGGTPAGTATAEADSWPRALDVLASGLR